MCGIDGFWLSSALSDDAAIGKLGEMSNAIAHRGPDDSDYYFDAQARVGLAHRRLAIVDLSAEGRQPMTSPSGRYVIVFNGEIYNFRTLRKELEELDPAPRFRGGSDTEVMLVAIEAWGIEAAVTRFVGMFAFALWDRERRRLFLVRDRLGVKPLLYGVTESGFCFGSELKALLPFPDFERRLNHQAVAGLLRWGYVPEPLAIYRGVRKLPPGTILELAHPRQDAQPRPYWDARAMAAAGCAAPHRLEDAEILDQVHAALRSAVELRMIADVPLGAFLSGGIDSSLVVALMQAASGRPVRTFSIGNESAAYDESQAAAAVAAHLGTEHTSFVVTGEDSLRLVPRMGEVFDEPFADASQVPTLLVSQLARQHVTVALTGDGGDEVFGGYNRHMWGPPIWRSLLRVPARVRSRMAQLLLSIPESQHDSLAERLIPARVRPRLLGMKAHKLYRAMGATSAFEFYGALCAQWQEPREVLQGPLSPTFASADVSTGSLANDMMLLDLLTYLPGDVLTKVDRATMAVALEARSPFLDHRVVELGWRLPARAKVRGRVGKWVLRELLYRYVPRGLVDRPKMGFAIPVGAWLRGPLREWAADLLRDSERQGVLSAPVIRRAWQTHLEGHQDLSGQLWPILMFQSWCNSSSGVKTVS